MSASCEDLMAFVRSLNPSGELNGEEGVIYGRGDRTADKVLVAWMPTVAAIEHAIREDCGIILSHEAVTFYNYFHGRGEQEPWTADRARLALLDDADITVIRAHSTVDATHVVPGFIRAVGLSEPVEIGGVWSYHEEQPTTVRQLCRKCVTGLGLERVRVSGDPERIVTRIGVMVGGLGLDRHIVSWERFVMGLGIEALLVGETNDFAQRFALDSGIALVETCHSASEEPGLEAFAGDLRARLPGAQILFRSEQIPWTTI